MFKHLIKHKVQFLSDYFIFLDNKKLLISFSSWGQAVLHSLFNHFKIYIFIYLKKAGRIKWVYTSANILFKQIVI